MRYICHDCGYEIPADMDFCPRCGCMADRATPVDDSGFPVSVCPQCGASSSYNDVFCGSCGARLPDRGHVVMQPRIRKYGMAALLLAMVPGFFSIFGIGHLLMRKWSKGCMFLAMSLVIWYLNGWTYTASSLMTLMLTIFVLFYHATDIVRVIYTPEDS